MGSAIDLVDLFYMGDRNGAADYLRTHAWSTQVLGTEDAFAANGFTLEDDEMANFARGSGYLTATLS
jgi:hypothetical protein